MGPRRKQTKSAKPAKPAGAVEGRHEISSGGIVWRRDPATGTLQIVMIKPAGKEAWTLPKGQTAKGETLVQTAARESHEETGLDVEPGAQVGQISYIYSWRDTPGGPLVRIFKKVYYFLMEPRGGDLSRHDSEIDEAKWVTLNDAVQLASYRSDREIIEKARAMLASAASG